MYYILTPHLHTKHAWFKPPRTSKSTLEIKSKIINNHGGHVESEVKKHLSSNTNTHYLPTLVLPLLFIYHVSQGVQ
jgi:hypothetical protein